MTESTQKFYVTTPIYYVNDIPHIGHAYTTIACDTLARYHRLNGSDVFFLTGTDEHGQKVEKAAAQKNEAPQDFVDRVSQSFSSLTTVMQTTHTDFIRTTQSRHIQAAQALWQKLIENGHIYLGSYEGWYAVRDEAFYAESEIVDGKAPTGAPVEWVKEPSYFFRLSAWQDKLLEFYKTNPNFIQPESRRNEVIRFVEGGLQDLSVSRTSFKWGVPVPSDPDHVMYVWLDALTNYITAIGYPDENTTSFKDFWPSATHVVGKDILRFHAVYWPAFLMAADLTPPHKVFAHGWWTIEGVKMSKSLGNVVDPIQLIESYGLDAVRYFLLREVPFGQDGDFSHHNLVQRYNSDLANAYGNLVQRVLTLVHKNCGGIVPHPTLDEVPHDLWIKSNNLAFIEKFAFHRYLEEIWATIANCNRYIDEQKPWALKDSNPTQMKTVLYVLLEAIRRIALLTQPFLPIASQKIFDLFNITACARDFACLESTLTPGKALKEPQPIFPRIV